MAGRKSRPGSPDGEDYQHTPQPQPVLPHLHSTTAAPLQYRFPANNGHIFRQVKLGFRRVGSSTANPKIPIPRTANVEIRNKVRARHACSQCRELKAKCTGHQPCQRCEEKGIDCAYDLRKKEVLERKISELSAENQLYQNLFRDLYPRLDIESAQTVEQVLGSSRIDVGPFEHSNVRLIDPADSSFIVVGQLKVPAHDGVEDENESYATKDFTDEDFNSSQHMQAMGIVGEHSPTVWLLELTRNLPRGTSPQTSDNSSTPSVRAVNYFQGEAGLDIHSHVDLWFQPPREAADRLVGFYFRTVHPEFPVIGKITFCWQYRSYFSDSQARPGRRWMALLNLIFAISAKLLPLRDGQDEGSTEHHAVYFARAWQLSIDHVVLAEHPDLQQVQVEGLAAFYLLCMGEINRSWRMLGTAIQSALAMGLHLRNAADDVHFSSKEIRYRVWWALFALESSLQMITGRPPTVNTKFCTAPLPIPYGEEDLSNSAIRHLLTDVRARNQFLALLLRFANVSDFATSERERSHPQPAAFGSDEAITNQQATQKVTNHAASTTPKASLFFVYTVDLAHLTHTVIETLYSPQRCQRSLSDLKLVISGLKESIDQWLVQLPDELNFKMSLEMRPVSRQSVSLGLRFYAAKILITRPCLHYLAYKASRSHRSQSFYEDMADLCVRAACELLSLLPSKPDLTWLYGTAPWWQVLHYIMLSIAVLLTELFMRSEAKSSAERRAIDQIQKGLRWLRYMSDNDTSAEKAWLICNKILSQHKSQGSSSIFSRKSPEHVLHSS